MASRNRMMHLESHSTQNANPKARLFVLVKAGRGARTASGEAKRGHGSDRIRLDWGLLFEKKNKVWGLLQIWLAVFRQSVGRRVMTSQRGQEKQGCEILRFYQKAFQWVGK